ncbi:MAG: pilus assembly protein, partial [Anaerolineae bacterium]|nr:pilus assembly protein [Anaerolineae bacterium]
MKRSMNSNKGGSVHVWAVLVLPLLIGFMGLTIDLGYILVVGQQLQTGADAGALAGARHLKSGIYDIQQAAVAMAGANEAAGAPITLGVGFNNAPEGEIVVGRFDRNTRIFTPDSVNYNAVQVRAQRTAASAAGDIPMFFASFFGVNSIDMSRTAIAMQGGGGGAGVI